MAGAIDWDDLRYFLAAARVGTLAGTARLLDVEHTTIGRRLTSLERSLGVPLILRRPDGLRLTRVGSRLVPALGEVERAIDAALRVVESEGTRVRLAVPSAVTRVLALDRFRRECPDVTLEISSGSRPVDLKNGEADLALRIGPVKDDDLVVKKLGDTGYSLYASDSYLARRGAPSDPRDLAGHDVLGYDENLAAVPGAKWIAEHGAGANIVLRSRDLADMAAAALNGVGLAVLPCMLAASEPSLRRVTNEVLGTRKIALVWRRELTLSAPVRSVIRFVTNIMRENAAVMSGR